MKARAGNSGGIHVTVTADEVGESQTAGDAVLELLHALEYTNMTVVSETPIPSTGETRVHIGVPDDLSKADCTALAADLERSGRHR